MATATKYTSSLAVDLLMEHSQSGDYCEYCECLRPCPIALVAARNIELETGQRAEVEAAP